MTNKDEEEENKGPSNNMFLQQSIPMKQLVYTPGCTICVLVCFGILFLAIGGICVYYQGQVDQFIFTYSGTDNAQSCPDTAEKPCRVLIHLENEMKGPIYFYYKLTNFYQNHQRFVRSRNDEMSRGDFTDDPSGFSGCSDGGFEKYTVEDSDGEEQDIFYYPCGLVAKSVFNDSFVLRQCSGECEELESGTRIEWTSEDIAWASSRLHRFKSRNATWMRQNCYAFRHENNDEGNAAKGFASGFDDSLADFTGTGDAKRSKFHCWHNVSEEGMMVWMRPAALSDFWKLHRIIEDDLPAGWYSLDIHLNFPVAAFGGTKGFVFTNASPLGGKREVLGALYFTVGAVTLVTALALTVAYMTRDKLVKRPQVRYATVKMPEAKVEEEGEEAKKTNATVSSQSFAGKWAGFIKKPKTKANGGEAEDGEFARTVQFPPPPPTKDVPPFVSNFVSTAKYTVLTFLPLNLMWQFQRVANVYFLIIACLASTPLSPVESTTFWTPLIFVLGVSAFKDAYEDYRRHQSDIEENSRKTLLYSEDQRKFLTVPWKDIKVGSIVMVSTTDPEECSPMIPSDLALLASSTGDGTCFLETANLDGETNLKLREAPETLFHRVTKWAPGHETEGGTLKELQLDQISKLQITVRCNAPDAFLYDFNAKLQWEGDELPLNGGSSGGQFLQRSTKLKNTKWVVGVAVYTGPDTKIQMNMTDPPNKTSNIEGKLNSYIRGLFLFLFILCLIGSIGASIVQRSDTMKKTWYLSPDTSTTTFDTGSPDKAAFFSFFSFLILFSLLIPISLYVTVELVKAIAALIISSDLQMYAREEGIPSKARSAGLCEELGQVNYIFSDKTGTLTQNLMEFKKCSVAGIQYGRGYCEVERAIARRQGKLLPDDPVPPAGLDKGFKFVDERLLFGKWEQQESAAMLREFFINLAVNHGVQVEYGQNSELPLYQAESPDEGAFVTAARNCGFFFCKRVMKEIVIKMSDGPVGRGSDVTYTILNVNAFDNNRKRTSVVVKDAHGALMLLVKGADTSVMPFIDHAACSFFEETQMHIDLFSDQGLRTLVFAGRAITAEEYAAWNKQYVAATLLPEGREDALRAIASQIEENHSHPNQPSALFDTSTEYKSALQLHGVTALEDKLQENVGECIAQLGKAFIKIWVLTGDKLETAINIGFATALLSTEMQLIRIAADDLAALPPEGALEEKLAQAQAALAVKDLDAFISACSEGMAIPACAEVFEGLRAKGQSVHGKAQQSSTSIGGGYETGPIEGKVKELILKEKVRNRLKQYRGRMGPKDSAGGFAMVIDGQCLRAAMQNDLKMQFLEVGVECRAVVCCRVTPSQKAQVTLLVKDNIPGQITLAIGDGANDVSMIQAAHIGIGIRGKEGQQAVLASDYALPRFAYLERLLLVHGRWSYNRIGTMVCYFFYKNIVFALTIFWYGLANNFSAQSLYDDGYQSLYNVIFTGLPVMFFAVLDRDLEPDMVRKHPELYSTGHWNARFSPARFWGFILGSVVHSVLLFYLTVYSLDLDVSGSNGRGTGLWTIGTAVLTNVIIVVTVTIALHTRSWSIAHVLCYGGSILIWYLFCLVYHSLPVDFWGDEQNRVHWLIQDLASEALFWLTTILSCSTCVLPILCYKYYREQYFPAIDDYYRRVVAQPELYGDGDADASNVNIGVASDSEYNANSARSAARRQSKESLASGTSREGGEGVVGRMKRKAKRLLGRNQSVQKQDPTRCDFTPAPERPVRTGSGSGAPARPGTGEQSLAGVDVSGAVPGSAKGTRGGGGGGGGGGGDGGGGVGMEGGSSRAGTKAGGKPTVDEVVPFSEASGSSRRAAASGRG